MLKVKLCKGVTRSAQDGLSKQNVRRWQSSSSNVFESLSTKLGIRPKAESGDAPATTNTRSNLPAFTNSSIATSISHVRHFASTAAGAQFGTNTDSNAKNLEDDGYGLNRNNDTMRWLQHFQQPPDPGTLILVRHGKHHRPVRRCRQESALIVVVCDAKRMQVKVNGIVESSSPVG